MRYPCPREFSPESVEQSVAAWGQLSGVVDNLLPYTDERRQQFSFELPVSGEEVVVLAEGLGIDDMLLAPGTEITTSAYWDWKEFYPDNPGTQWSLGKFGLASATAMEIPEQPTAVHLVGSKVMVRPNWPIERLLGLAMLYDDGDWHTQELVGMLARNDGRVRAIRIVNLGSGGMRLSTSATSRDSDPIQTRKFASRAHDIIKALSSAL
jgi:hypothetical protein